MGANEHGVVIGNVGLPAKGPLPKEQRLLGMDLVRLALERSTSAKDAVEVVAALLQQFGQGGNCGHLEPDYYQNGFIVTDASEGFVLETVGGEWLVERVCGIRALSNKYSINHTAERTSEALISLIHNSGWGTGPILNYAEAIGDVRRESVGHPSARSARAMELMSCREGRLSILDMMEILRDHGQTKSTTGDWHPWQVVKRTLCAHALEEDRRGQTVGSMVSQIRAGAAIHWVTATAAPCLSIFKPVLLDVPLPWHGPLPTDRFSSLALWWQHEKLHRSAESADFARLLADIRSERDELERNFLNCIETVLDGGSTVDRSRAVAECWRKALDTEERWLARVSNRIVVERNPHESAWLKMNAISHFDTLS